jgi:hypothetical protein
LSELDETGGRIVPEITFRLTTEGDEVGIVGGRKAKFAVRIMPLAKCPKNAHRK